MRAAELKALDEVQKRVLWLSTRIVDAANRERENPDGIKVGGHQASSASLVSVMTALYFHHLDRDDKVSVKPHASPVLHAISYLLGGLDKSYLTMLRQKGGLQAYPSRTKDPDRVDFSTGSVGLGAAAPLFAAVTRRYVDEHFGKRPASRFVAVLGDAELDEGNVWEAIGDPATRGLGTVMWVVDFNRQSLDRVVPELRLRQLSEQFAAAGWHVAHLKYGEQLSRAFSKPGGEAFKAHLDEMENEQYQALFGLQPDQVRELFLQGASKEVVSAVEAYGDEELAELLRDLGGHDMASLCAAFEACDAEVARPSVVFAYTVKGFGLPIAGNPRNHSALLSEQQIGELRDLLRIEEEGEWERLDPSSPGGRLAARRASELEEGPREEPAAVKVPAVSGFRAAKTSSTQEAFGRVMVELSRDEEVAHHLVTTAPDVATSTNLAGFINRMGVFAPRERRSWSEDKMLRWTEGPKGHHIELGISEMNLFLLLGQLGLAADLSSEQLLAVGTVYDPFVLRGLDAFVYSVYSGARFVVAGTPSGISLAPEGGAHQSTITASVGLELPGVTFMEPAYASALDWLLCDALGRVGSGEAGSYYFRLSTRPIDQAPFERARERLGEETLWRQVLEGAYLLTDPREEGPVGKEAVCLVSSGAVMPEVLAAAAELEQEGVSCYVVDVCSLDRLYRSWQEGLRLAVRDARRPEESHLLASVFPRPSVPVVSVHDASSHAMAFLGSFLGAPMVPVGVDDFGQSGSLAELYGIHGLTSEKVVNAALAALQL